MLLPRVKGEVAEGQVVPDWLPTRCRLRGEMATDSPKGSRFRRAVSGLLTIVVGILLALAANAWWQGRQEKARSRIYLEMLRADLRATDSLVELSISQDQRSMVNSRRMADVLVSARSWSEVSDSLAPHFGFDDVWFRTGTVTALLTTGDINNVSSDALRSAVVRYADEVDVIRNSLSRMESAAWSNVSDYTHAEQQLIDSSNDSDLKRRLLGMSTSDVLRSFPLGRIRQHPEIAATFRLHAIVMANRIEVLRRARGPTEDLLRLLDQELGH